VKSKWRTASSDWGRAAGGIEQAIFGDGLEPQSILSARGVSKDFRGVRVVDRIDLEVYRGERLAIVGASGSGKSTVCRLFVGLEYPDEGTIYVAGQVLACGDGTVAKSERERRRIRRRLGFVPQQYTLFPHMTLSQNVELRLRRVRKLSRGEGREIAKAVLNRVGLSDKVHAYPGQLSGGQRQRGTIARELAMQRDVLIFDEPTSALDLDLRTGVLEVVRQLATDGLTMVVVTHEMDFAQRFADRVAVMDQGRLAAVHSAEQFFAANSKANE